ncbi:MAG: DUF2071 domain-containing protein [Luteolibacter sp.]|uniref:DUF2071 domain-containing protein n=1 Tax=Luteolibacter sp. TaxID=1962973 RepID=UPI0032639F7A
MKLPAITGIIRRRILLNYRVAPEVVEAILPANFRPKFVNGYAIAGICLIRLEQLRPKGFPGVVGFSSENSAHRIAVEWEDAAGNLREGVFVPRRDTDSYLTALGGGRIFPGVHHHSDFTVSDSAGRISIHITEGKDHISLVGIQASETHQFPESSVFGSFENSSRFFEAGCVGYSSRPESCVLDGLLLKVGKWVVTPLEVDEVSSAYFDDHSIFPPDSIDFDHALLMRDIPHEWHSEPEMTAERSL